MSLDQAKKEKSNRTLRKGKLVKPGSGKDGDTHQKLRKDDEKPEPHYPRTQEREKRIKSAFRHCNLKILDRD